MHRQAWAALLSPFIDQKLGTFLSAERADHLKDLARMVEEGTVTPSVGCVLFARGGAPGHGRSGVRQGPGQARRHHVIHGRWSAGTAGSQRSVVRASTVSTM